MTPAATIARPSKLTLQRFFWLHPEWWSIAISGLAWVMMLREASRHFGHAGHRTSFPAEMSGWMLMTLAMMLPLVLHSVRMTARASLWSRRHRAIAGFLTGFVAIWMPLGLVVATFRYASGAYMQWATALAFGVAVLWQRTSWHQRALMYCHWKEPLAPRGWRADLDCVRYGAIIGAICMWSCWPLMLACGLSGHSPVAMAGGMLIGVAERWYYRPRARRMMLITLALALYYSLIAILPLAAYQSPPPVIVASTTSPFTLGKDSRRLELPLHPPDDPLLRRPDSSRRVFLNVEKMLSAEGSPPWLVYLNLPADEAPARHPELLAGELPLYGLAEASRRTDREPPGFYEQLEITGLYARLSSAPAWNPKLLTVTLVPRHPAKVHIHVSRVTVSMTRR